MKSNRKYDMKIVLFIILTGLLAAWGCSTTKRLGDNDILYTGVRKYDISAEDGSRVPSSVNSDVQDVLFVAPNNPLFSPFVRTGIPTGLWAYNYLYRKGREKQSWLYRRLAKNPVLIADVQPALRSKMAINVLENHGYFNSTVEYEIIKQRNPKKARINYRAELAPAWHYGTVEYPEVRDSLTELISLRKPYSPMQTGLQYNVDTLAAERTRITNWLRRHGYYYFRANYIEYLADTVRKPRNVDLRMVIPSNVPEAAMRSYNTGHIEVRLSNPRGDGWDTMSYNGIEINYQKPLKVRPRVLYRALTVEPDQLANVETINGTLSNLNRLGIFRSVNLEVTPLDSLTATESRKLDMRIDATLDSPLQAELEVDVYQKSNAFIGPGIAFGVRHNNIFRGGEALSVKVNGAYEWQTGNTSSQVNASGINSYEFGLSSSLSVPRLVIPKRWEHFDRYNSNKTVFNIGGSIMNRPKFFTMLSVDFSTTYYFRTSSRSTHEFTPARLTYNTLLRTTENFQNTMDSNRAIELSFRNQFIPATSYAYTYSQTYGRHRRNKLVWRTSITTSGNSLAGIYSLLGAKGTKEILGNPFSQFVKVTTEFRHFTATGSKSTLAVRLLLGAGYAYGNSEELPYSEQFFIGGANSIRAFTIRSIGPGSYRSDTNDKYGYFDQTGDFKFEANVEWRFNIWGGLNGAVFVDAGNIWLIQNDPERPGGQLKAKNFWKELALGTGVGLRYDISFLVIRLDLGIGIHTPYENPDKSGYYNISRFKDGLGLHIAVGYPF